jgi:hypothetical protein
MGRSKVAGATRAGPTGETNAHPTLGFGVPATSDPHHFKVTIPRSSTGRVLISEYLGLQATGDESAVIDRVTLDRARWAGIRSEAQRAFNARLSEHGLKPSAWKVGDNVVDRLLGKELCVLAWAVEHLELAKTSVAVRNWLALRPEERWWLFGMTAMSTGGLNDGDKGWRLALRHALGDMTQSEPPQSTLLRPPSRRQRLQEDAEHPMLDLFGSDQ